MRTAYWGGPMPLQHARGAVEPRWLPAQAHANISKMLWSINFISISTANACCRLVHQFTLCRCCWPTTAEFGWFGRGHVEVAATPLRARSVLRFVSMLSLDHPPTHHDPLRAPYSQTSVFRVSLQSPKYESRREACPRSEQVSPPPKAFVRLARRYPCGHLTRPPLTWVRCIELYS
jgi:hypothetical protein